MASQIDIANRALQKVGAKQIGSLTEGSVEADAVNSCYDILLNAELQTNAWKFALKRVQLPANSSTPDPEAQVRAFVFQLPSDFVRVAPFDPVEETFPLDHLVEGRTIVSDDASPLDLRYVSNTVAPEKYDPLFIEALAARISIEIVETLTQSNTKKAALEDAYAAHVRTARSRNAIQAEPTQSEVDDWITVRSRYAGGGDNTRSAF